MRQAKGNPYGFRPSQKTLTCLRILMEERNENVTEVIEEAVKQAALHEAHLEPLLVIMLGEKRGSYRRKKPPVNPLYFRPSEDSKRDVENFMEEQDLNKTDVVEACIIWYFLQEKVMTAA